MLKNLIKLRKERGLRQKDIADACNVAISTYSYWENGKNEPDFESLKFLANYFGVSIDYLLDKKDEQLNCNLDKSPHSNTVTIFGRGTGKTEVQLSDENIKLLKKLAEQLAKEQDEDK